MPDTPAIKNVTELESSRKDQRKFRIELTLPASTRDTLSFLRSTIDIPKVGSRHPTEGTTVDRFSIEPGEDQTFESSSIWIVTILYRW
jgi:hypothetical protein